MAAAVFDSTKSCQRLSPTTFSLVFPRHHDLAGRVRDHRIVEDHFSSSSWETATARHGSLGLVSQPYSFIEMIWVRLPRGAWRFVRSRCRSIIAFVCVFVWREFGFQLDREMGFHIDQGFFLLEILSTTFIPMYLAHVPDFSLEICWNRSACYTRVSSEPNPATCTL